MHSAKDVCHDKPLYPSTLEPLVWTVGRGANAVESDCALDSAFNTLGSHLDDVLLITGDFCTDRRKVDGVDCNLQAGAQYHVYTTIVPGPQMCNVKISRRRIIIFPGQGR
jgi:hypothetical protein